MSDDAAIQEPESRPDTAAMLIEGQDLDEQLEAPVSVPDAPVEPAATDVTPPVETPAETQPSSFIERLAEFGFENVETPEDAQERLLESYRQLQEQIETARGEARQFRDLAEYGNEYLKLARDPELRDVLERRRQPQSAQTPPKPEAWWNPPAFDVQSAQRYREIRVDPSSGERAAGWKDGTPAEMKLAAEQYQAYVEDWVDRLSTRPQEVLPQIIEREFERLFEAKYGAKVREQQTAQFLTQFEQDNAYWLYAKDPRTNGPATDARGAPVLSPAGQKVLSYVNYAESDLGIADARAQWEYATAMHELETLKARNGLGGASAAARETREQKRAEHLARGAGSIPDRSGSLPTADDTPGRPQNGHTSPGQRLIAQLQADGAI
ncbi:MAG: hypothetical protein ACREIV_03310 [Planctomycetaceae bacterium]